MKKLLLLIVCLRVVTLTLSANATWFTPYIGAGISSTVKYKYNLHDLENMKNDTMVNANLGSKINVNNYLFLFSEVYFNVINNYIEGNELVFMNMFGINSKSEFKNIYGLNAGFGCNFNEKFNIKIFGSVSENQFIFDYNIRSLRNNRLIYNDYISDRGTGFGFGLDFGYYITKRVETILGYKFSRTTIYVGDKKQDREELKTKFFMHSINLGLAYDF